MSQPVDDFDTWLTKISRRPVPSTPLARLKTIAKELADGILNEYFPKQIYAERYEKGAVSRKEDVYREQPRNVTQYLKERWGVASLDWELLETTGFVSTKSVVETGLLRRVVYTLQEKSFSLLEEQVAASVFISYRRAESSAFALLILSRLKTDGINAFLDMSLLPGENWQSGLRDRIVQYDIFVLVIGRETLRSEVISQEIQWALEANLTIIPIWHNTFIYRESDWPNLSTEIRQLLETTHTIRVLEESASGYNTAIVELLNRFGVTPD